MAAGKKRKKTGGESRGASKVKVSYRGAVGTGAAAIIAIILFLGIIEYQRGYPSFPERIESIAFFVFMCFGMGYGLMKAAKVSEELETLEYAIMAFALGFCVFPVVIVLLTFVGIPLDWKVLAILAIIAPAFKIATSLGSLKEEAKKLTPAVKKADVYMMLSLVAAALLFLLFVKAAFQNPYMEDGDPWMHVDGIKYIAVEKTYVRPAGLRVGSYLEPYPPSYDALLGVIHQLNTSVFWTSKFFTQVIVALGVVFCFFFVKEITGNRRLAFFSAFFLAITPPYLSHIIWAHAYSVVQFFAMFYFVEKARKNGSWSACAAAALGGSLLIQPLFSLVNGILYLTYVAIYSLSDRKAFKRLFIIGVSGLILSMAFWVPTITSKKDAETGRLHLEQLKTFQWHFGAEGYEKLYKLDDFINVKPYGDIFTHQGLGLVYVLLIFGAILWAAAGYRERVKSRPWFAVILLWTAFIFTAMQSWVLPISIFPARFWGILPITACILGAEGFVVVEGLLRKNEPLKYIVAAILIAGMLYGTAYPRYLVQTAKWYPGVQWNSEEQFQGYQYLWNLKPNTRVFAYCMPDYSVLSFDVLDFPWDYAVEDFRKRMADPMSVHELYAFLKSKEYEYLIFDSGCGITCTNYKTDYGKDPQECMNNINNLLNETIYSPNFAPAQGNRGFVMFKVN